MKSLTRQDIVQLVNRMGNPCVSIYMPTDRTGAQAQTDTLRLTNLLGEAERKLSARGMSVRETSRLLEPAREWVQEGSWRQAPGDGLALFVSTEGLASFQLSLAFPERLIVAPRPHVTALLPLLNDPGKLFVLALSQDQVRLIEGSSEAAREVELEGMPKNLAEALKFDEPLKQRLFRTIPRVVGRGRQTALFYGQGVGTDDTKVRLLRYLQQVDKGLHDRLKGEHAPLVLACVGYLFPLYAKVNTYPRLHSEYIEGNPDRVSAQELYARARLLLEPQLRRARENAWAKYQERIGTGLASNQVGEIVPAAHHGRVETLFLRADAQLWGSLDADRDTVILRSEFDDAADELCNLAAIYTLLNQGTVYVVEEENLPADVNLAAVFRY